MSRIPICGEDARVEKIEKLFKDIQAMKIDVGLDPQMTDVHSALAVVEDALRRQYRLRTVEKK